MYTVNAFSLLLFAASSVCCADYSQMIGHAVLCSVSGGVGGVDDCGFGGLVDGGVMCSGTLSVVW